MVNFSTEMRTPLTESKDAPGRLMGCATLLDERAKGLNAAKILLVPETADLVLESYS